MSFLSKTSKNRFHVEISIWLITFIGFRFHNFYCTLQTPLSGRRVMCYVNIYNKRKIKHIYTHFLFKMGTCHHSWHSFMACQMSWLTYILNWSIQSFSWDYDLVSHSTHVVCFNFIHEWRNW